MMLITVEGLKKIGQIKENILGCSTKESIDNVFSQFGINDFSVRTIFLRQSMQVKEVFDVPGDKSMPEDYDEDNYKEELAIFLDGKWRELI